MEIKSAKDLTVYKKAYELVNNQEHKELTAVCMEIGKMLGAMINRPAKFLTSDL